MCLRAQRGAVLSEKAAGGGAGLGQRGRGGAGEGSGANAAPRPFKAFVRRGGLQAKELQLHRGPSPTQQ